MLGSMRSSLCESESSYVLRSTTTDDLKAYLSGPQNVETAWLSPERQHEEAWFLGLRMNAGVSPRSYAVNSAPNVWRGGDGSGCAPDRVWPADRRQIGEADRAGKAAVERGVSGIP